MESGSGLLIIAVIILALWPLAIRGTNRLGPDAKRMSSPPMLSPRAISILGQICEAVYPMDIASVRTILLSDVPYFQELEDKGFISIAYGPNECVDVTIRRRLLTIDQIPIARSKHRETK